LPLSWRSSDRSLVALRLLADRRDELVAARTRLPESE
jgi:hypothetical protein